MGAALGPRLPARLWTAYRENRFGYSVPRPFVGFLVLVEDLDEVNRAVKPAEMITRAPGHWVVDPQTSFQSFAAAIEGHALTFRKTIEAHP